jgi:hypothetical protein
MENLGLENAVRRTFQNAGLPTRDRINELPPSSTPCLRGFYEEEIVGRRVQRGCSPTRIQQD